jgi:co-chaperonin GroES (HSP10)
MIVPCNRHLIIEHFHDFQIEDDDSGVLVPEEYLKEKAQDQYTAWKVKAVSVDVAVDLYYRVKSGDTVMVENNMVKEVKHEGKNVYMVQENYILWVEKNVK